MSIIIDLLKYSSSLLSKGVAALISRRNPSRIICGMVFLLIDVGGDLYWYWHVQENSYIMHGLSSLVIITTECYIQAC